MQGCAAQWVSDRAHLGQRRTAMKWTVAALTGAAVALAAVSVHAAGPYDGTWQVEAAAAGTPDNITRRARCEGLRLQFEVKDNQIEGSLARSPRGRGRVTQTGRGATPITGTVQPDGTVHARWESFDITGKLTGDRAELRWNGQCGPRVAMGGRIQSTEGSGSSSGAR
jgi:hypothetical protein